MWILKAAAFLAVPILIAGGNLKLEPFLPDGSGVAVSVWTEVSLSQARKTYVVHEVYDKTTGRSFLEYYDDVGSQRLLADRKSGLIYGYSDSTCALLRAGDTADFYRNTELFRDLQIEDIPAQGFLGPASIFDEISKSSSRLELTSECKIDRPIPCVQYKTSFGRDNRYWYSDANYNMFGENKSRPLRYKSAEGVIVEVLSVKIHDKSQDLFVPTGLSCFNPTGTGPDMPFDTSRRSFVGEVLMTADKIDKVLISKLEALILPSKAGGSLSGIYSFALTNFRTDSDGDRVRGDDTKYIHDVDHNVVYTSYTRDDKNRIADKETKCEIYSATDFDMELEFPAYGRIKLKPIFLDVPLDQSDASLSYLGANRIGSEGTEVYEVTYVGVTTSSGIAVDRLVVSHHFSASSKLLKAVEINAYGKSSKEKIFSGIIYISKYENKITHLNEKLRVDDCPDYQDSSESRWVQIGFEDASGGSSLEILESAPQIRDAFIDKLQAEYAVDPMRLPQINIDFVDEQVLVQALLLERPLLDNAFKEPLNRDFKTPTRVLGIMSMTACQVACLGTDPRFCTALSYCGATCSISNAAIPAAPALTVTSDDCLLYERSFDFEIRVSAKILRDLREDVTTTTSTNGLLLKFKPDSIDEAKEIEIKAVTYDDTKNFDNAFHYDKDKVAILETSFALGRASRRYKSYGQASLLGSLELEDCALACKNRRNCEAFSYCANSMECMISPNHDISTDDVEEDNECIAYQKKYVDRFEKYPGLTLPAPGVSGKATNEESCAQQCIQREDCKSFEFCDSTGDCLMLTTHIADAKIVEKQDHKEGQPKCIHYSKKFLFDYSIIAKKRGSGDETTELAEYANITQAACAKLCSEWASQDTMCLSFDFCAPAQDNTGLCTLRTVDGKEPSESPTCNFLYLTVPPSVGVTKHGSGQAIGLSVLMLLIGAGLAFGGLFLFNKYH